MTLNERRKLKIEAEKLDLERVRVRADYLTKQYGYYTTHMNQVFNFDLVAAALIASAFVQSLSGPNPLQTVGSQAIAAVGAVLSLMFLVLHMRGFRVAGLLDDELKQVEIDIGVRFMQQRRVSHRGGLLRNTVLFGAIYALFIVGFLVAVLSAGSVGSAPRASSPSAIMFDPTVNFGD